MQSCLKDSDQTLSTMGFCSVIQVREIKIIPDHEDPEVEAKLLTVDFIWLATFIGDSAFQSRITNKCLVILAVEDGNLAELEHFHLAGRSIIRYRDVDGRGLLHMAAMKNKAAIIDFLLSSGVDINAIDNDGNSSLHLAAENDAVDSIEYLIFRGADTTIKNTKRMAAIHLAAEKNNFKAMQLFVLHKDKVDILMGGENGKTPLHIAANNNFPETASALLSAKLRLALTKPCDHGVPPIIEAARNAAYKTLEVMLKAGKSMGYQPIDMMKVVDAEGNTPLHSAVHSGDVETVKLCLKNGAKITTTEHSKVTPVHLACAQGTFEILRLMFALQPEEKSVVMQMQDAQGMSPLHCAATYNHQELVTYLIQEGAAIDSKDSEGRTPLLLAASRAGWTTVQLLIRLGADVRIRDKKNRNLLHLIVTHGGSLEDFTEELSKIDKQELHELLNEQDIHGCTPLHFATRGGRIRSTESLIRLGACVSTKNNDNESPLHFATRYGRYNTVVELLAGERGSYIINETDGEGMTPLHIAAQNGHTRIVQLLLNKGALLERDFKGLTPLHLAAENGYIKTMAALLAVHAQMVDQTDKLGNTPLHLAAINNRANALSLLLDGKCTIIKNDANLTPMDLALHYKHHESAMAMATHESRAPEMLEMNNTRCEEIIQTLIATMPEVFMAVLDKCIDKSSGKEDSDKYYIRYDFQYLQYTRGIYQSMKDENKHYSFKPLPAMNSMVQHRRLELLCHPICQKYIQMKWNGYGMYFHMTNLMIYIVFMTFLTTFAATLMQEIRAPANYTMPVRAQGGDGKFNPQDRWRSQPEASTIMDTFTSTSGLFLNGLIILVFVVLNIIKEIVQLVQQKLKYILDPINFLEWLLYISSAIMVFPIFIGEIEGYQLQCAAVAAFLSWFNFLLYLQRFDKVGIYVVMFLEILKTLVKALLIFSILFVAFGLAFFILLSHDNLIFSSLPVSFIRVFSMMLGEFDILGTFVIPIFRKTHNQKSFFPHFTLGFLVIFMILMPILLVNLLIGLAVGDIEGVRRNAQLKRMAMQVELHTELERKIPHFILEKVDKEEVIEYPNTIGTTKCKWFLPIIQKFMGAGYAGGERKGMELGSESPDEFLYEELYKQKQRMKDMTSTLDQLHLLVRLVVRKMEIRTEADDCDENESKDQVQGRNRWSSPALKMKLRTISALMPSHGK